MAARTETQSMGGLYLPSGERLDLTIREVQVDCGTYGYEPSLDLHAPSGYRQRILGNKSLTIRARIENRRIVNLEAGDRLLYRIQSARSEQVTAVIVTALHVTSGDDYSPEVELKAVQTALEPGEQEAVQRWHDREAIIERAVDSPGSMTELWSELRDAFPDASERSQATAEITRRRAERQRREQDRQAVEARMREAESDAERHRQREAAIRAVQQNLPSIQRQPTLAERTEEALRRLSGGTDLNKPKKRKIDLGD